MKKIRMFKQVVELGEWGLYNYEDAWVVKEIIDDAEQVNMFLKEICKKDVIVGGGTYYSPRLGKFCFSYKFIGENETES